MQQRAATQGALTEEDGGFTLGPLAPGRYTLTTYVDRQKVDVGSVDVEQGKTQTFEATLP